MQTSWYDGGHRDGLVDLVQSVAAQGGAVGWVAVPSPEDVDDWLASLADARLAIVTDDSAVLGCGFWRRQPAVVLSKMAEIRKVMTHPSHRRTGAGRAVMEALIVDARTSGVELITLDCRGNNHGAQRLYAGLGFQVTGRRPDAIAVGDERFDQVLMHLDLREGPQGLIRHGSRRQGPGAT